MANKQNLILQVSVQGAKVAQRAISKTKAAVSALKANWLAVTAALAGVTIAVKQSIDAFFQQEKSVAKLSQALKAAGDDSKGAMKEMRDFATELQKTTTIADETAIEMLAIAKTFNLTNEGARELVAAAADLSTAMGTDIRSSVIQLGKTLSGLQGEIGESVAEIRDLTTEQLLAGGAIDLVREKYRGFAQNEAKTTAGQFKQFSNLVGDTAEKVGELAAVLAIPLLNAFRKVLPLIENATKFWGEFLGVINKGIPEKLTIEDITKKQIALEKELLEIAEKQKNPAKFGLRHGRQTNRLLGRRKEILKELNELTAKSTEITNRAVKTEKPDGKKQTTKTTVQDERKSTVVAELKEQAAFRAELAAEEFAIDVASREQKLDMVRKYLGLEAELEIESVKAKEEREILLNKKLFEAAQVRFKHEEQLQAKRKASTMTALSTISGMASSNIKELAVVGRAAAIAQAIINTHEGATKALAIGGPFGIPLMAGVIAAGFAQVANIMAQPLPMAEGGIVLPRPGGTLAQIGEAGRAEAVIPLDDSNSPLGNITINFNGAIAGDKEQAREFALAIQREIVEQRRTGENLI